MLHQIPGPTLQSPDLDDSFDPREAFGDAFDRAIATYTVDAMLQAWAAARVDWLKRCRSDNTRASYKTALNQFFMFIGVSPWLIEDDYRPAYTRSLEAGCYIDPADLPPGVEPTPRAFQINPWEVSGHHVNQFVEFLASLGKTDSTVGQRLAAGSSFYKHVISDARLGPDGVERTLFFDRSGRTRANPFQTNNVQRPEVKAFGRAHPVPVPMIYAMMTGINTATVTGARNFALLESIIQTGWRSQEIRQLRWGDIKANPRHRGEYIVAWSGKGDKSQTEPFPRKAYDAIEHFLKLAGRWPADPGAYVFARLQDGHSRGLKIDATEPYISGGQANAIMRGALRRGLIKAGYSKDEAAAEAARYHVHCLRHSHAQRYLEEYDNDLYGLQLRLHHSNSNTTRIYAESDAIKRVPPAKQLNFGY